MSFLFFPILKINLVYFILKLYIFVYQTDGGIYEEDYDYYIDNLFMKNTSYCYSSRPINVKQGGVHLQAYLGRQAENKRLQPSQYRVVPNDPMHIKMPIE